MKRIAYALVAIALTSTSLHAQSVDSTLKRLESSKWHPSSLGSAKAFADLYANDFTTVEYGADPTFSGVQRVAGAKKMLQGGGEEALIKMMDQMTFDLTDWQFQHVSPTVTIVSYNVTSPQFAGAHLWATSVWRKTGHKWQTVFYQASKAKP